MDKPINVRPYKYGHIPKEEIERLVTKMLQAGSSDPMKSFVQALLLVKKRDGGDVSV